MIIKRLLFDTSALVSRVHTIVLVFRRQHCSGITACTSVSVTAEDTHPVKALGLEEMSVDSVEFPPSSGPAAIDRF